MPGAQCTRSLVCAWCSQDAHEYSQRSHRKSPGIPARNGFNGLWRALPGDEFVLPPSPANSRHVRTRLGRQVFADLTPATGARTTRFCRPHQRRSSCALDHRSRPKPPCDINRARRCRVHRIPPRVRDDRDTPLEWDETAWLIAVVGISENQNIFSYGDRQPKSPQI